MRILLACEFYYPSVGGVQEVMRQLAERFVERGHQVTVATTRLPERSSRKIAGVRIVEFDVSGNLALGLLGDVEGYRRYVTTCDFDVFMVKAAQQWTIDALIPVLDRISKPKIFIPCGFSGLYEPAYANYFREMPEWLRKFDHLIFYASDYRDINFAREHGIVNLTVIPNGASEREFGVARDTAFRARYGIPEAAFVILTVGSPVGLKGHLEIARAFEQCDFGDRPAVLMLNAKTSRSRRTGIRRFSLFVAHWWAILVHGYRKYGGIRVAKWLLRTALLKLRCGWMLRALGYRTDDESHHVETIRDVVTRINLSHAELVRANPSGSQTGTRRAMQLDLPRAELIQAYLNSDLFVFASKVEYSPLVLYEAAAAGLPFLSASVGNAKEIAEWTGAGVVFDAPRDAQGYTQVDPSALAAEIASLVARPELLVELAANGRRAWEARFTWEKIAALYEQAFEQCAGEQGAARSKARQSAALGQ